MTPELPKPLAGFTYTDGEVAAGALAVALASGLFTSAGEARRAISQGGVSINGERVAAADAAVPSAIDGAWLLVRFGKRRLAVGRRAT